MENREPVSLEFFTASLRENAPPEGLGIALQALWYEARTSGPGLTPAAEPDGSMSKDWNKAHNLVQRERNSAGRWVHGYLHRIEGDDTNAAGWYERAEKTFPASSPADEWAEIATELLAL